jgi:hypothetical protein
MVFLSRTIMEHHGDTLDCFPKTHFIGEQSSSHGLSSLWFSIRGILIVVMDIHSSTHFGVILSINHPLDTKKLMWHQ